MSKFRKNSKKGSPGINTASLPDIVFMLLFFFMVVTRIKDAELKVKIAVPTATEVAKLEDKSLTSFIFIGRPTTKLQDLYGTSPRVQLNDAISRDVKEVKLFITAEIAKLSEDKKPRMIVSMKADKDVKMGIVTDVKQELREVNALKLNYSTHQGQIEYDD
jgi:biopolymer transport protein ExbD